MNQAQVSRPTVTMEIDLKHCEIFEITKREGTKLLILGSIYHQDGRLAAYESFDAMVMGDWVIGHRESLLEHQVTYLEKLIEENEQAKIQEQEEESA